MQPSPLSTQYTHQRYEQVNEASRTYYPPEISNELAPNNHWLTEPERHVKASQQHGPARPTLLGHMKQHVAHVMATPAMPTQLSDASRRVVEQTVSPMHYGGWLGVKQYAQDVVNAKSGPGPVRSYLYAESWLTKSYPDSWEGRAQSSRDLTAALLALVPYALAARFYPGPPLLFALNTSVDSIRVYNITMNSMISAWSAVRSGNLKKAPDTQ